MRPTWVEVDTGSIAKNIERVRAAIPGRTQIMAVVKADGYGHGAVPVAIAALKSGATFLGVALVEEGIALRRAGIVAPILFMEALFPWQAPDLVRYGLTATVASHESADVLSESAALLGRKAKVHIKVDTGMGRLGLPPEAIPELVRYVSGLPRLEIEGIFTHLACAESDPSMTRRQLGLFRDVIASLAAAGYEIPIKHVANSAAALCVPEAAMDMVRIGGAMYGISPLGASPLGQGWQPALSFKTRVSYVKPVQAGATVSYGATYAAPAPQLIATLPVGYADGYSRLLSGRGDVLIGGVRCSVAGRVCMDQIMAVLPPEADVEVGDEAVLIGAQGNEVIYAEDIARIMGTIAYEVVCGISKRVPRVYVSSQP